MCGAAALRSRAAAHWNREKTRTRPRVVDCFSGPYLLLYDCFSGPYVIIFDCFSGPYLLMVLHFAPTVSHSRWRSVYERTRNKKQASATKITIPPPGNKNQTQGLRDNAASARTHAHA